MPDHFPANLLEGVGFEVDATVDVFALRFVFGSVTRFAFGLADCSDGDVGDSSTIGAGSRGMSKKKIAAPAHMVSKIGRLIFCPGTRQR